MDTKAIHTIQKYQGDYLKGTLPQKLGVANDNLAFKKIAHEIFGDERKDNIVFNVLIGNTTSNPSEKFINSRKLLLQEIDRLTQKIHPKDHNFEFRKEYIKKLREIVILGLINENPQKIHQFYTKFIKPYSKRYGL